MADNHMKGHDPTKKFYYVIVVDNADGSLGSWQSGPEFEEGVTLKDAVYKAKAWSEEYEGETFIYECRPIKVYTGNKFKDRVIMAAIKENNGGKQRFWSGLSGLKEWVCGLPHRLERQRLARENETT